MKSRKLVNGQTVSELDELEKIAIQTKCPDKWLFVDLETGDVWQYRNRCDLKFQACSVQNAAALAAVALKKLLKVAQ